MNFRAKVVNFLFIVMKCVHRLHMLMGICMVIYIGINLSAVLSWGKKTFPFYIIVVTVSFFFFLEIMGDDSDLAITTTTNSYLAA